MVLLYNLLFWDLIVFILLINEINVLEFLNFVNFFVVDLMFFVVLII